MKNLNNWKFVIIALVAGVVLGWVFFHTSAPGTELVEDHAHEVVGAGVTDVVADGVVEVAQLLEVWRTQVLGLRRGRAVGGHLP